MSKANNLRLLNDRVDLVTVKGGFCAAQVIIRGNGVLKCSVSGDNECELNIKPSMFKLLKVNVNKNSEFLEPLDYQQLSAAEMKQ